MHPRLALDLQVMLVWTMINISLGLLGVFKSMLDKSARIFDP